MERPAYQLQQKMSRVLLPKIVLLLGLGVLFYVGVLLVISLLNLPPSQEPWINVGALVLLIILIGVGILLDYKRARKPYNFYNDRIGEDKLYSSITNTIPKQNWLDKMFKTYSIDLGNGLVLRNIPEDVDMKPYLDKLVSYNNK